MVRGTPKLRLESVTHEEQHEFAAARVRLSIAVLIEMRDAAARVRDSACAARTKELQEVAR
jgi:hypothetical protein